MSSLLRASRNIFLNLLSPVEILPQYLSTKGEIFYNDMAILHDQQETDQNEDQKKFFEMEYFTTNGGNQINKRGF